MAKISQIASKPAATKVDFGDGTIVNFSYKPGILTPARDSRIQTFSDSEKPTEEYVKWFLEPMISWDLEAEDSTTESPKIMPLTLEALMEVPSFILNKIARAIIEDQNPNVKKSGGSGSFS